MQELFWNSHTPRPAEINIIESKLAGIGMKRYGILALLLLSAVWGLAGCSHREEQEKERQPIEFTVVESRKLPQELQEIIEENKDGEIRMAYEDGEDLYLIRGYGMQKTGGYSISVTECSEDEETIRLDTQLIGPKSQEDLPEDPSYPCLVIKMEMRDKDIEVE